MFSANICWPFCTQSPAAELDTLWPLFPQVRRSSETDPLQRRDQRGPQQSPGPRAERGGGSPQRPAVRSGTRRHHREWVSRENTSQRKQSELRACVQFVTKCWGITGNVSVWHTRSPLSSVLSAYRCIGPVITGLKCAFHLSEPALCNPKVFIFTTPETKLQVQSNLIETWIRCSDY